MTLLKTLLKHKNIQLTWVEQVPSMDSSGKETPADIIKIMSVKDCINLQRLYTYNMSKKKCYKHVKNYKKFTEEELLNEFISVNWAVPISKEI